jgi:hypothetical protein
MGPHQHEAILDEQLQPKGTVRALSEVNLVDKPRKPQQVQVVTKR